MSRKTERETGRNAASGEIWRESGTGLGEARSAANAARLVDVQQAAATVMIAALYASVTPRAGWDASATQARRSRDAGSGRRGGRAGTRNGDLAMARGGGLGAGAGALYCRRLAGATADVRAARRPRRQARLGARGRASAGRRERAVTRGGDAGR